jgi:hypothetical protein
MKVNYNARSANIVGWREYNLVRGNKFKLTRSCCLDYSAVTDTITKKAMGAATIEAALAVM